MKKILVVADCPNEDYLLDSNPDAVFLLGDIDYYLVRKIDAKYDCPKFGVLGNHDGPDFFEGTTITDVHKRVVEFEGYTIAGFEGSPYYNKRKYLQYDEEDVFAFTNTLAYVDIFIAHSNPMLDVQTISLADGHRGFAALTHYIKTKKPQYFLHGHLHNDFVKKVEETTIISVYPCKEIVLFE